jgi:hypothetical protein
MRIGQKKIDAIEFGAVGLGRRSHVDHFVEGNERFGIRPLADHAGPHRIMQFRPIVFLRHRRLPP